MKIYKDELSEALDKDLDEEDLDYEYVEDEGETYTEPEMEGDED